jgi:hypothetical protein
MTSPTVHVLDPLTDTRWDDLLARDTRASVFHSRGWLEALKRTYGYDPIVLTTSGQGPLANGLALCRVRTWLSRRLVSLPFSDHCDPLFESPDDSSAVLAFLAGEVGKGRWSSFELRPRPGVWPDGSGGVGGVVRGFSPDDGPGSVRDGGQPFRAAEGARYLLHTLDLARPAEQIFSGFHHSSTQRAIRRAEREGLSYESGTSERLLSRFYGLLRQSRRRHGLPPQPIAWFRSLIACLRDGVVIHVASKDGRPIAGILTFSFKKTLVFKYGGSDAAHHSLGGMPFLFWRAIQEAQAKGIEELDLGRSDLDQPGLIAFKDHLGATQTPLTYFTHPERRTSAAHDGSLARAARRVIVHLPDAALDFTGRVLYRHRS